MFTGEANANDTPTATTEERAEMEKRIDANNKCAYPRGEGKKPTSDVHERDSLFIGDDHDADSPLPIPVLQQTETHGDKTPAVQCESNDSGAIEKCVPSAGS